MEQARARVYRFGAFELDVRAGELRKGGLKVRLQEQPLRILVMLLEHPGEVVLREEIRQRLWPNNTIVEFDHGINAAIKRLRDALGESADSPRYVETLERRGYRFIGQVEADEKDSGDLADRHSVPGSNGLAGATISHYRVIEKIGSGGMGVVYKAQDVKLGREVALKLLSEELTADPEALKRFEREARAASALNHPNICTIYGVEEHDSQPIIAMELVEGDTLAERIRLGRLPVDEVLGIARQMAEALEAAHENGIVHRDFKPDNVKIKSDGRVKVLDFGLAKLLDTSVSAGSADDSPTVTSTRIGMVLGTASYMSPEQARGEAVDKRTDIWAFGVVLYEMVTGERPFQGATVSDTLAAVLKTEASLDAIPARVRPLIERCLEKDPKQRLRDIGDARIALSEMGTAEIPPQIVPQRPTNWRIAARVVGLIAAIAILGWWRSTQPQDLFRYRDTPFAVNLQEQGRAVWSPDGKSVAYTGMVNNHPQAFVRNLNSSDSRQLTSGDVDGSLVVGWSPDSKRVLFLSPASGLDHVAPMETAAIFSTAVIGGGPERLSPLPRDVATVAVDVSPDNQAIAVFGVPARGKVTIFISSPLGSPYRQYEPAPFSSTNFYSYSTLRFSPNGTKLLLIRTGESGTEEAWLLPYPPGKSTPHRVLHIFRAKN